MFGRIRQNSPPNYYEIQSERYLFLIGNVESDLQLNGFCLIFLVYILKTLSCSLTHTKQRRRKKTNNKKMNLFIIALSSLSVALSLTHYLSVSNISVYEPVWRMQLTNVYASDSVVCAWKKSFSLFIEAITQIEWDGNMLQNEICGVE